MPDLDYVITLVHGTFAPSSRWTLSGSKLREHLKAELGENVHFETFKWGVTNSQARRQASADHLAANLKRQVASRPQAKHFVLCHSHAGNIALYSLRDAALQNSLHGVVCMNTPFVTATRRSQSQIVLLPYIFLILLSFFYAVSTGLFLLVWCVANLSRFGNWIPRNIWEWLPWIGSAVLAAGLGLVLNRYRKSFAVLLAKQQEKAVAELALPEIEKPTVLCLRTPNDEVYGLFQFLGALSAFPLLLLHPIALVVFIATALALMGPCSNNAISQVQLWFGDLAFRAVVSIVLPLGYAIDPILGTKADLLFQFAFNVIISVALLAIIAWGILVIAVAAQAVLLFAMGFRWWSILRTFFVHIGFNEVPVSVHRLRFREFLSPLSFLVHSNPYNNPDALAAISSFIKERSRTNEMVNVSAKSS
jgi:hypothetical protein